MRQLLGTASCSHQCLMPGCQLPAGTIIFAVRTKAPLLPGICRTALTALALPIPVRYAALSQGFVAALLLAGSSTRHQLSWCCFAS